MSNIVLADEINRASAKTQSSLLEAMEERQVTVDGKTYPLEEPFMVMATQNPLESFGTYHLLDAQIDRFLIKLSIGYPSLAEEAQVVLMPRDKKNRLNPVASKKEIRALSAVAKKVYVSPTLTQYIAQLLSATRTSADTLLGSSPRGGISLVAASRVYALMQGREYVLPASLSQKEYDQRVAPLRQLTAAELPWFTYSDPRELKGRQL